jgi:hypothetical protein
MDVVGQNGNDGLHYPQAEEQDPTGLGAHDGGAKLDYGKPRADLVLGGFAKALLEVVKVGTFGANKYSADGWKSVDGGLERYTDALQRHYLYEASGELIDQDSGLMHASHLAWNALARIEFLLKEKEDEDRCDRK